MEILIFKAYLILVLLEISSICNALTCYELCANELPERLKWWKSKEYGLEITGDVTRNTELQGLDKRAETETPRVVLPMMKKKVDELIADHKKKKLPDFTITKMDPISYDFKGQKMLITFEDIKLSNLDTYDKKSASYTQVGTYLTGNYEMNEAMYAAIKKDKNLSKRIHVVKGGKGVANKYNLDRKDVEWKVKLSANFISDQEKDSTNEEKPSEKPIIIDTEFKIQPDFNANDVEAKNDENFLRAKGVVKIKFFNFNFDIIFVITHIDDPLRKYFPANKFSENLAPDFEANYGMDRIEILKEDIRLLKYDGDDTFPGKENRKEDVNENLPVVPEVKKGSSNKTSKKKVTSETSKELQKKEYNFIEDNEQRDLVAEHFEVLKNQILTERAKFEKKLCLNLLPKMTWKIMRMKTKRQLTFLLREIIAYDDDFQEKTLLADVNTMDTLSQGRKIATTALGDCYEGFKGTACNWLLRRSQSAP